ncbi:hypothetical protein [Pedobacter sp. Leaf170]|uniref:hypothetical protein n=1 Tax=Pedobacter sp. Leaf170 TaxID=2876558 RepID=UPI001E34A77C|nr:hypothetical protein [Pedobacter sp. Leaf170]
MAQTKTISKEELEEKKAAAAESYELKAGTQIRILKVGVGKVGLNLEIEKAVTRMFANAEGVEELRTFTNLAKEPMAFLPHHDFNLALELLRSHLIILCEQKESFDIHGRVLSPQELDNFEEKDSPLAKVKVTGFDISSGYGIIITGAKIIRGKQVLSLSTGLVHFEGFDEDFYEFGDELLHVAKHAMKEAELYYNGKYMPDAQMKIGFQEEDHEDDNSTF